MLPSNYPLKDRANDIVVSNTMNWSKLATFGTRFEELI
jgi:hypothetical protein